MKIKLVLAALLIVLLNTGSSCVNDSILVAVNLPISHSWAINPGNNPNFSGATTSIVLAEQMDASFDNVEKVRYYDIRVSVAGTYSGNVTGTAYIAMAPSKNSPPPTSVPLLTFSGSWADFQTPQSLLGSSPHITPQPAGIAVLVSALNAFTSNSQTVVYLSSNGSLSSAPVPSGLSVKVEIFAQADAQVGNGNSNP